MQLKLAQPVLSSVLLVTSRSLRRCLSDLDVTNRTEDSTGSVGNIQIAEALSKLGHEVDRKIIVVKDAVKEVGSYKAIVKLHKEVSVEIPFEVVAE